jgi:dihydrolipoamide dehydrogenase
MLAMPFYHPVIEEALQDGLHQLAKQLKAPEPAPSWIDQFLPWRRRMREAAPA